jgi:hypothetical protein
VRDRFEEVAPSAVDLRERSANAIPSVPAVLSDLVARSSRCSDADFVHILTESENTLTRAGQAFRA